MNRLTKIGGAVVGVGAGIAAVLWLMRDRLGPEVTPVSADEAPAFRVSPPRPRQQPSSPGDDLTVVTGIGPVYHERLEAAGITTFAALAAASPSEVSTAAGVTEDRARDWIEQAAALAG